MKKNNQNWWGVAALVLLPLGASAAEPGMYAGIHLGGNNLDNWPATVNFGAGVSSPGSLSIDKSWQGGLVVGRQVGNGRFEAEYQYGRIDVTGVSLAAISRAGGASGHYHALTVNAYRTHDFSPNVNGYIGVGVGLGQVSLPALAPLAGCNCFRAASKSEFAFQARVGAEYSIASEHRVFAQYTWLRVPGADAGATPSASYPHKTIGTLGAGYRRMF